jgi:Tol biopolymer transport system component
VALVAAGIAAIVWMLARPSVDPPRLSYVTTAHQLGIVGYRDPVGAISVDGRHLAYAEGRRLYEVPIGGGQPIEIAAADGQIRHVVAHGPAGDWIFEDGTSPRRWWVASARRPMRPLFDTQREIEGSESAGSMHEKLGLDDLRQVVSSPDGQWIAGVASGSSGAQLWRVAADGSHAELVKMAQPIAWPTWSSTNELACTVKVDGRWRLSRPCGQPPARFRPDVEVIGPIAWSSAKRSLYFASPNDRGTVDLWLADLDAGRARRLTAFARDTYAPSVVAAGDLVLFKTPSYRTSVVELDVAAGTLRQLSTLQSETPSYHPDGRRIAVTYGTWRRLLDDAKYPDIAQEIGVLMSPADEEPLTAPAEVIAASDSEDQAMAWSPNGKWIAFHSHREQSDDVWLRPADRQGADRRVSFLGRGAEVGWPRWSADGKWVLYDGASPATERSVPFVFGIDQESGAVTAPPREVGVGSFAGEITHAEWLPDSATIVAIAKESAGRHAIVSLPASGGEPRVVHRFASEHDFPGLATAPDGQSVAFVAPAPDGFFQIFRLPIAGGMPEQITIDRSNKSQPAWSPDGRRLAFTVWSYDAQFWTFVP